MRSYQSKLRGPVDAVIARYRLREVRAEIDRGLDVGVLSEASELTWFITVSIQNAVFREPDVRESAGSR
jgi:hypothetical protein